jgi:hypothetical protein
MSLDDENNGEPLERVDRAAAMSYLASLSRVAPHRALTRTIESMGSPAHRTWETFRIGDRTGPVVLEIRRGGHDAGVYVRRDRAMF